MEYVAFIKYLTSKNIILFDHDNRLAYNNIKTYMLGNSTNNMTGGGNIIFHFNDITLKQIINTALSSEPRNLYWFVK